MTISRPEYILPLISTDTVRFEWNEWDVHQYYTSTDEDFLDGLSKVAQPALCGLTIASAEWIAYRFEPAYDHPLRIKYVMDVIEAAWAGNVHSAYCRYFETNDDDWRGPVLGPSNMAVSIVLDALFCVEEIDNPAKSPMWMSNLVRHVLEEEAPYLDWLDACKTRLNEFYPLVGEGMSPGQDAAIPVVVPRAFFDPRHVFDPVESAQLVDRFLSNLDYNDNPFLRSPEELEEMDFEGTPYAFKP